MSFILDALKKSESERQRQSGPALFEVKIAPPRNRFAVWGAAIGALLVVNFVVVGWVLWRGSATRAAAPAAATSASAAPTPSAMPSAEARAELRPEPRAETRAEPRVAPSAAAAPAAVAAAVSPAPASPTVASAAAPAASGAGASLAGENPDDLAPAVEPHGQTSRPVNGVIRATESGLPTYQDAAAEPGANIPSLRLDLHVYSPQPNQSFVFLNMLKLREGDATPQGVRIEHITQDGVILSYRGKEFVLQRQ